MVEITQREYLRQLEPIRLFNITHKNNENVRSSYLAHIIFKTAISGIQFDYKEKNQNRDYCGILIPKM